MPLYSDDEDSGGVAAGNRSAAHVPTVPIDLPRKLEPRTLHLIAYAVVAIAVAVGTGLIAWQGAVSAAACIPLLLELGRALKVWKKTSG